MAYKDKGVLKDEADASEFFKLSALLAHFYTLHLQGKQSCPDKQAAEDGITGCSTS